MSVIEQLPVAVAIVEVPSGKTIFANALNNTIFRQGGGRAREGVDHYGEYVGLRPNGEKLGPRDWPLSRSIATGEVIRGEEVEIVRGDGSRSVVRISSGPVIDDDGKTLAAVVIYDDISAVKRQREVIRFIADASQILASSLDYETTLQTIAKVAVPRLADWCSIDLLAADGTLLQVAVEHVDPQKVALAREWRHKYPPDMNAKTGLPHVVREGVSEIYSDIPDELLVAALRHDPERLRITRELGLLSAITVPLLVSGKAIGALSLVGTKESGRRFDALDLDMANEIAARAALAVENARLYREAQRAVWLRDDFLAVASHELRTPLHTLSLVISGLRRARDRDAAVVLADAKLDRLQTQVDRLNTLVATLLDVSRFSNGKLTLAKTHVDLGAVVRDVVARFAEGAEHGDRVVGVDVEGDVAGQWDLERVDQVVTNLVANALKYAPGAPVKVVVRGSEQHVELSVADEGPGIPAEHQERIFERFERASSSKSTAGLGLGLWIVKQAVAAHDGVVSVSSRPGAGATFSVRLPRT